jgi:hypothetical protein
VSHKLHTRILKVNILFVWQGNLILLYAPEGYLYWVMEHLKMSGGNCYSCLKNYIIGNLDTKKIRKQVNPENVFVLTYSRFHDTT